MKLYDELIGTLCNLWEKFLIVICVRNKMWTMTRNLHCIGPFPPCLLLTPAAVVDPCAAGSSSSPRQSVYVCACREYSSVTAC